MASHVRQGQQCLCLRVPGNGHKCSPLVQGHVRQCVTTALSGMTDLTCCGVWYITVRPCVGAAKRFKQLLLQQTGEWDEEAAELLQHFKSA